MNEITTEDFDRTVSLFEDFKQLKIDNFNKTIELFNDYKQRQQEQKMRGLNDFNVLTAILRYDDERRLHSKFICQLLDPKAEHYQDDLFLKLFLKQCELDNFFIFDTKRCHVEREYRRIDIYITDGNKHIIIENKIWADDQDQQIKRYIETIEKENELPDLENLCVIYLSLDKKEPSSKSLGEEWNITEDKKYLENKENNKKCHFLAISYKDDITGWLVKSHKEVANITNLSMGISQYLEVIDKLYGKYKEKVMKLEEYIFENTKDSNDEIKVRQTIDEIKARQTIEEIHTNYPEYEKDTNQRFWKTIEAPLKNKIQGWEITRNKDLSLIKKGYVRALWIKKSENSKIYFLFEYDMNRLDGLHWGISTHCVKDDPWGNLIKNNLLKPFSIDSTETLKNTHWLCQTRENPDIMEKIANNGIVKAAEEFSETIKDFFEKWEYSVTKCNDFLEKQMQES